MTDHKQWYQEKNSRAWVFYDWANSAFATTVMAGLFPVFFKQWSSASLSASESTFWLGAANSGAGILFALALPLLAALAARKNKEKAFLLAFTLLSCTATLLLALGGKDDYLFAIGCYAIALIGFSGALVFYDALLPFVAREGEREQVSSAGYALGYLGGGMLLLLQVLALTFLPSTLGIEKITIIKWSFVSVALWWLLFSLPLFSVSFPKKTGSQNHSPLSEVWLVCQRILSRRELGVFLVAYWLYMDGVNSVIKMAVDFGVSLGFEPTHLLLALLLTQFVGFPAALLFGLLARKIGNLSAILGGLAGYIIIVLWGSTIEAVWEFFVLAALIACVQGGVQAISRAHYADLIPQDQAAEYFSFFNFIGKFATILGPLLVGIITAYTDSPRFGILSLVFLFIIGGVLVLRLRKIEGGRGV